MNESNIHLWGRPTAKRGLPTKAELAVKLNSHTKEITDFSGLTIQDMVRLERALSRTIHLENLRTKKEHVEALSLHIPEVKNFQRLNLQTLRNIVEVLNG